MSGTCVSLRLQTIQLTNVSYMKVFVKILASIQVQLTSHPNASAGLISYSSAFYWMNNYYIFY